MDNNGPYPPDVVPGFWTGLADAVRSNRIRSPILVYEELLGVDDGLKKWAKDMNVLGLFIDPDEHVQHVVTEIADYVEMTYPRPNCRLFLSKADPWVIAHAKATGGVVVTREKLVGANSQKVKIPNVCEQFGVQYVDTYEMIRQLGMILH